MTCTAVPLTLACYPARLLSSALDGVTIPQRNLSCWSSLGKERSQAIKARNVCADRAPQPLSGLLGCCELQIDQNWKPLTFITHGMAVPRRPCWVVQYWLVVLIAYPLLSKESVAVTSF